MAKLPVKFDPIRKQLFVENLTLGLDPMDAARAAGFPSPSAKLTQALLADEEVQGMVESHRREMERRYDVSRDKVLRDLTDLKDMAMVQADVKAGVMAINPIIDIMGYRAPKQVNVEQNVNVTGNVRHRMRQISDEELLKLAGDEGVDLLDLTPTTVGGETVYTSEEEIDE